MSIVPTVRNGGDIVAISIRDEGIGVAREDRSRILDRIERVETPIVSRITDACIEIFIAPEITMPHGGQFRAESERAGASIFRCFIPTGVSRGVDWARCSLIAG